MLSIGSILQDRYRIDRMQDIGAMEARYRGWDQLQGEPVFVRELTPQPDLAAEMQDTLRSAFARDAAALVSLDHPHIVRLCDAFMCSDDDGRSSAPNESDAHAYLIQQAVAGQTLADVIAREGTIREARVVGWARDLLDALSYVHERGIIHRDLRPDAVLITPDDHALLTNFEIVALWNPSDPRTWTAKRVMGVPQYAPPECWGMHATQVDARSDIYSLGATLYHALTGEQPLTAGERTSNPYQFLQVKALAPRVHSRTRAAILKAMELPLDKRFQTAAMMRRALDPTQQNDDSRLPAPAPFLPRHSPSGWPRVWGLLVSTLILFLAGVLGVWLDQTLALPALFGRVMEAVDVTAPEEVPPLTAPELIPSSTDIAATASTGTRTQVATPAATVTTPEALTTPLLGASVTSAPANWQKAISDTFYSNVNGWVASAFEDDWGSTNRSIVAGVYRWEIEAIQAVSRWCTPELDDARPVSSNYFVSVDAQRLRGPESAAYGLVLRHTEGSYYLFSVRDDGYYQFSLWDGFAWQPVVDWTPTTSVVAGASNRLAAKVDGIRFDLFINDTLVHEAEDNQLAGGEAGLSISTAATEGLAVFVFDNFGLWVP